MQCSKFIYSTLLGWHFATPFPDIPQSVVIFAPHTSYWDAILGKLFFNAFHLHPVFLIKKTFFYFPLGYILKRFGGVPVQGVSGSNAIFQVVKMFHTHPKLHVVISPEGAFKKRTHWNRGFLYMARKAGVPITVGYFDYQKKEIGIKGVLTDLSNETEVMRQIASWYSDVSAKHPENFTVEDIS